MISATAGRDDRGRAGLRAAGDSVRSMTPETSLLLFERVPETRRVELEGCGLSISSISGSGTGSGGAGGYSKSTLGV
jgi:hypothetical protein